jgi:hypothetical protein
MVGSAAALVWSALGWAGLVYASPEPLAVTVGVCTVLGALVAAVWPISSEALAQSIDRRAHLKDALGTAIWSSSKSSDQAEALQRQAEARLEGVTPRKVFPNRFSRWHGAGVAGLLLASAVFLLGNTGILDSEAEKAEKEALEAKAVEIERIAEPIRRRGEEASPAERRLAEEMEALAREMERGRLTEAEAMRRTNQLTREAEELLERNAEEAKALINDANQRLARATESRLAQAGLEREDLEGMNLSPEMQRQLEALRREMGMNLGPGRMERAEQLAQSQLGIDPQLAALSSEQTEQLLDSVRSQQEALQQELRSTENLTDAQREAAEQQLADAQQLEESLELAQRYQELLGEMLNDQQLSELQDAMEQLSQQAQRAQAGEPMDPEQLQEALEQLEQMLANADSEEMQAMIEELMEAAERLRNCPECQGTAQALAAIFQSPSSTGSSGAGQQLVPPDNGQITLSEEEWETIGETTATAVRGEWQEEGDETYVEIAAPTTLGSETSIRYQDLLPEYREEAESAISREEIPRRHQQRVRNYFESLGSGR